MKIVCTLRHQRSCLEMASGWNRFCVWCVFPRHSPIDGRSRTGDNDIPRTSGGLKASSQTIIDSATKLIDGYRASHRAQPDRVSPIFPELLVFLIAFDDDEGP